MKLFKIISYLGFISWFLLGITTILASIYIGSNIVINCVIGLIFLIISYYLYFKTMSFILFTMDNRNQFFNKFYISELIFHISAFSFGILLLLVSLKRILVDGFTVFG